jgi:hypothetical protein
MLKDKVTEKDKRIEETEKLIKDLTSQTENLKTDYK